MRILPYVFVTQETIDTEVRQLISTLGPDVVLVNYSVGEDRTGDPAIHFRIVLINESAQRERLASATRAIIDAVTDRLDLFPKWGLFPYFIFRSQSEQPCEASPSGRNRWYTTTNFYGRLLNSSVSSHQHKLTCAGLFQPNMMLFSIC